MHFAWRTRARPFVLLALAAITATSSACRYLVTGAPEVLHPTPANAVRTVDACGAACVDSVDVVSLGVAGVLVVPWRDTTNLVLTPPSFTSPSIPWLAFGDWLFGTHADSARIAQRIAAMPAANDGRLSRVRAVLVGHGHYDHLLDLPPMLPRMPRATVYGSNTVTNMLAPVPGLTDSRRVAIDSVAGTSARQSGRSLTVSAAVSVRPIRWAHAPNIGSFTIAPGDQRTPRRTLPRTVHGWKMGQPYAWVIDLLAGNGSVAWRFVYHDASADAAVQRQAAEAISAMPMAHATAILATAANFDQLPLYPDITMAHLAPAHVLLVHWDDFFRDPSAPQRVVRGIRADSLIARLQPYVGNRWSAPAAGSITRFRW